MLPAGLKNCTIILPNKVDYFAEMIAKVVGGQLGLCSKSKVAVLATDMQVSHLCHNNLPRTFIFCFDFFFSSIGGQRRASVNAQQIHCWSLGR
jgi:hypothetical protein